MQNSTRQYWVDMLVKIIDPVLKNFSEENLHKNLKLESNSTNREKYMGLEILGRTLVGAAYWFESKPSDPHEEGLRKKYANLARKAIEQATNPESNDFCFDFPQGEMYCEQWLVDAAHLALAIVRAPCELADMLNAETKENLLNCLISTRKIRPCFNNWVLFSAMVEAGIYVLGGNYDMLRVDYAIRQTEQWYIGDGMYKDGPTFKTDYYNGYILHPFYVTLIQVFKGDYIEKSAFGSTVTKGEKFEEVALKRLSRYARVQEMNISPDGSFPPVGRSIVYRCGAFQPLALSAYLGCLPKEVTPAMARCALTKVIKKTLDAENTFNEGGWLNLGLCGHQNNLAEFYITTASLYLCTQAFLPLGLSSKEPFWSDSDEKTSWEKISTGENIMADHAMPDEFLLN